MGQTQEFELMVFWGLVLGDCDCKPQLQMFPYFVIKH